MIDRLVRFSIQWRYLVVLFWAGLVAAGFYAAIELPIDAVPDVTTNQVQINTTASGFSPLEMEQYVTFPIEVAMSNLPRKTEVRSISQFGLSQVTVTFEEGVDIYWARQLVLERLVEAERRLPEGASPGLAPISTGLGEIYHFTLEVEEGSPYRYTLMELRTLLDWFIKPELRNLPGVVEVNSFGGHLKQYEVLVEPQELVSHRLPLSQVIEALRANNSNIGAGYLERGGEQQLLRGVGLIQSIKDIEDTVVAVETGTPVRIKDLASVGFGSEIRQGAATRDGAGETVMGIALLLKGENSRTVTDAVREKLEQLGGALPPGVKIQPFYDRSTLVNATVETATTNLVEGGVLVILVLLLFLLQWRAGLIVSSAIPLSMLFAIIGMYYFGVSANLMSLGAIDFGLIVDGAVIIVENCVRRLSDASKVLDRPLTEAERVTTIQQGTIEVRKASQFGELIIIAAYLPILSLAGMEGKMFRPMALTVILALSGALILSFTLIPALSAIFLRAREERRNPVMEWLIRRYRSTLSTSLRYRWGTLAIATTIVLICLPLFYFLGAEFLPELDEGAVAINHHRLRSASLSEGIRQTTMIERAIGEIPEVDTVVSRIGRPEIATDPMGPNMADTYAFLKPRSEWREGLTRSELFQEMSARVERFPGVVSSFSQPIQFRMMELIEGVGARSDVVIKIFGDDLDLLLSQANQIAEILHEVPGARDVRVQQVSGLPTLEIEIDRNRLARYGLTVSDVQEVLQSAIAGVKATTVLEGFMRFDAVVRLAPESRNSIQDIRALLVSTPRGEKIPLSQVALIETREGPAEISRENGRRRVSVEVNVSQRDVDSFVTEARARVSREVPGVPGHVVEWGGMFEHLESGRNRLMIAVPVTFFIVFVLLVTTFNSLKQAVIVFTGIPFAISGGILALLTREIYFSMSAGVGFIAVSGVAVLNGIVLVTFINQLRERGGSLISAVYRGAIGRLRPVLMTALVASLGFVPMAFSTGTGAEVQRPLATVVIGGLMTSTLLTLFVLPALYILVHRSRPERPSGTGVVRH